MYITHSALPLPLHQFPLTLIKLPPFKCGSKPFLPGSVITIFLLRSSKSSKRVSKLARGYHWSWYTNLYNLWYWRIWSAQQPWVLVSVPFPTPSSPSPPKPLLFCQCSPSSINPIPHLCSFLVIPSVRTSVGHVIAPIIMSILLRDLTDFFLWTGEK